MYGHVGCIYTQINIPFFDSRRGAVLNVTRDGSINVDCINLTIYAKGV